MGTRSETIVKDGDQELVRIYRQYDGYPSGHGVELAKLCDVKIVNGLTGQKDVANGMGCLAAQIVSGLKEGPGGIYIEPCGGPFNDGCDYTYIVTGAVGGRPNIECKSGDDPVFSLPAADVPAWVAEHDE